MRMWFKNTEGKDATFELVEGFPLVFRYNGEPRFGRFIKLETVGQGRWKTTVLQARTPDGQLLSGSMFWFSPVVTKEEIEIFATLDREATNK